MSNSLERFSRQLGLLNQDWFLTNRISVIGVGNLGTPLCINLAKAGFREIYIYDPDIIEAHNLPNQLYSAEDLRRTKVAKIIDLMHRIAPAVHHYYGMKRKIRLADPLMFESEIMVVLTDNITSRVESFLLALMYKYKVKHNIRYFIEAGTHAHTSKIYMVDLNSIKQRNTYFESLLERHKAPSVDLPCTERSTFFYASFIASVITGYLRNLSMNEDVPFETWIDLKSSQVMKWEKISAPKKKWSIQKMLMAYDDDYNSNRIKQLTRVIQKDSPFSQSRFEELSNDQWRHQGEGDFTWLIHNYLNFKNRIKLIDNMLYRIDHSKRRRRQESDRSCSFCMCDHCRKKHECSKRPCKGLSGCGRKKLGRTVYCKDEDIHAEGSLQFIHNLMKEKKITNFERIIKQEIRKWSGFDI